MYIHTYIVVVSVYLCHGSYLAISTSSCNHTPPRPQDQEANWERPGGPRLSTANQKLRRTKATHPDGTHAQTPDEEGGRPQRELPQSTGISQRQSELTETPTHKF